MKDVRVKSKLVRRLCIALTMIVLSMGLVGSFGDRVTPAFAQGSGDEPPLSPSGWGEEGTREVGVEWINDFEGTVNDRSHWDESCDGLYNKLRGAGWVGKFRYTDWNAWEVDFKDESRGGQEETIADSADIVMLCTHGSSGWDSFWNRTNSSVYFGGSHDDHHLVPGDAYNAYGDQDMEWLAFDSCSVLRDGSGVPYPDRSYWAATMDGLHLLLGFGNTMYVISTGDGSRWADYMLGYCPGWWPFGCIRPPYKVAQSWFEAVDDLQPGGVCARVLAERPEHFNDYLHGKGPVYSDTPTDGTYHWRQHCSCTPPPRQLASEQLDQIQTLPVYEVLARQVDETYVREIGLVFGISETEVLSDTAYYYMLHSTGVETFTLQVDRITGGYKYRNISQLGVAPDEPPELLSEERALALGESFLGGNGAELPGAAHTGGDHIYMVEQEMTVQQSVSGTQILQSQTVATLPLQVSLSYGRVVSASVGVRTPSGIQQQQEILSLVGPGARTKMYLGDLGKMLGVQGGSRDIQTTGENVNLMTADKAWELYLADPTIALAQIPWSADVISRTAETLGYYEQPHIQGQVQLIPAWIFTADFYAGDTLLDDGVAVYVPASAEYLPPVVEITAPAEGDELKAGDIVSFTGAVTGQGTPPEDFEYAWYSSYSGLLGTEPTIQATLTAALLKSDVVSHTITLKVTDANGQQGTASRMVFVKPTVYLPLVLRNS